ncbi:hypothetical protein HUJ04_012015 [Dendroctonus ponderosae]|nr:hypothetical protein HUJ04_012015 [Dendroctonus ponderosae]
MAESRGSLLAKSVQKHAGRAKEKVGDSVARWPHLQDTIAALQRAWGALLWKHTPQGHLTLIHCRRQIQLRNIPVICGP